jgi:hypothetical protein
MFCWIGNHNVGLQIINFQTMHQRWKFSDYYSLFNYFLIIFKAFRYFLNTMFNFEHINKKIIYNQIYLWSNIVVLFFHAKIFQTMVFHAMLLVSSKSFQWVGVHQLGLKLFRTMVWKLLIIEPFSQWNLGAFLVLLESSWQVKSNRVFISQF